MYDVMSSDTSTITDIGYKDTKVGRSGDQLLSDHYYRSLNLIIESIRLYHYCSMNYSIEDLRSREHIILLK